MNTKNNNKVFVIGFDGASPELINKWQDELPNFKKIIDDGVFGILESTKPPLTCPAWNCFATGKNPGKLGLFDWEELEFPYKPKLSNWKSEETIWDILSSLGKKVIVINVPLTFPPNKVNGYMISGFPMPYDNTNYTYPKELRDKLNELVGKYEVDIDLSLMHHNNEKILDSLELLTSNRLKIIKYMMDKPWDFFVVVFTFTDRIQHYFWHYMDEDHPQHVSSKYKSTVKDCYKKADDILGDLLEKLQNDTNLIIMSDHGFGPLNQLFFINTYLERNGILKTKRDLKNLTLQKLYNIFMVSNQPFVRYTNKFLIKIKIYSLVKKILFKSVPADSLIMTNFGTFDMIDMERTGAIGLANGKIYINKKSNYDYIYKKLYKIFDNIYLNGEKIPCKIYDKNSIYNGRCLDKAPDILLVMDNFKYDQSAALNDKLFEFSTKTTGYHRLEGLFMAKGPLIRKNINFNAKIYDLAPTILHIIGTPIPMEMDGRVLTEILESDDLSEQSSIVYNVYNQNIKEVIKDKEIKNIKEKIKSLKINKKI